MWLILTITLCVACFLLVAGLRKHAADQRRIERWSDLHERGKMLAEQLALMPRAKCLKNGFPPSRLPCAVGEAAQET
jgi:hypothetical protein